MIPVQPTNLLPQPFAQSGAKVIIPDQKPNPGRASFKDGFPEETQLPLNMGGIAPNRMDFNGMFYMLSAFGFWQQSGGLWNWRNDLNYTTPCLVFYGTKLWWCLQANGPNTPAGARTPGTTGGAAYWQDFLTALANMAGNASLFGAPVGTIIMWPKTSAPTGYLACNGNSFSSTTYPLLYAVLGVATTPDLRGYFIRGYDTRNTVDPDGAARAILSVQQDAMQRIQGSADMQSGGSVTSTSGAFYSSEDLIIGQQATGPSTGDPTNIRMDSALVTRTASETRPKNKALLFCIKHD